MVINNYIGLKRAEVKIEIYRLTNMWNIGKANNYMLKFNLFLLEINNNMYVT